MVITYNFKVLSDEIEFSVKYYRHLNFKHYYFAQYRRIKTTVIFHLAKIIILYQIYLCNYICHILYYNIGSNETP